MANNILLHGTRGENPSENTEPINDYQLSSFLLRHNQHIILDSDVQPNDSTFVYIVK